ncbi:uncharacterized protein LOC142238766 isoform X2 [Haematobia irritans]|uniref:uncharacterized protein LOC142238766 isoform X2 n=1 Tax=Haematobia irritans TaxID=7368 RepID=UPI003F4FFB8D
MNRRRQLQLQAAALQRARQHSDNAANTNTVNSDTTCQMEAGAKVADCPPAYDDIVQPPLDVKQPCQEVATGSTANQSSNAISTITIDTNIPSNVANTMASENSKDPSIV